MQIRHQPRGFLVVVVEELDVDWKRGDSIRLRFDRLDDSGRVERHEPPSQLEDVARAAAVLLEADARRELEVVQEVSEDRRVRAGPRIDRLLVVADGEHVAVILGQRLHDPVLHRIQVLKFVDEDDVPTGAHGSTFVVSLEQLGGLDDQRIEVDDFARREESLVAREEHGVVVEQRVAAKAVRRKPIQRAAVPPPIALDATQDAELILLVGDAEARFEQHVRAEFAQQLGAKRVNRSALDVRRRGTERGLEAVRDFARGFVGEGERADARRIDAQLLHEMTDALDQAVRLAGAGSGEDQQRSRRSRDRRPLRIGRRPRRRCEALAGGGRRHARDYRAYVAFSCALASVCPWRLNPTYAAVAPAGMSSLSVSSAKSVMW